MGRKPGQNLDPMSRPWHKFSDQKSGLKMALPALNGQKSWSSFGSDVTTLARVFGPKVRAQNGATCPKWAKSWSDFGQILGVTAFSWRTHKKTRSDPGFDQVKTALLALNGSKSHCILVDLSLAKQPPRGPFARELRTKRGAKKDNLWTIFWTFLDQLFFKYF